MPDINSGIASAAPITAPAPNPNPLPTVYVNQNFADTHDMSNPAFANYKIGTPAPGESGIDYGGNKVSAPIVQTTPNATETPNNTTVPTEADALRTKMDTNSNLIDSAITGAQTNLNNIINGTIPLTPSQLADVQGLQAQFDELRKQQLIVNKNYEAGITQAGIVSGRNMYAPEIEAGNIAGAMNEGIQKIAQLDSQASKAISDMKIAFEQKNFDNIKNAYDLYTNALKMKQDNLQAMYNDVVQATKDARDFAYKQTQDAIQNQLNSDKFNLDKANAVIDNALKTAQITKTEAETLYQQAQTKQLNIQLESPGLGGTAPMVQLNSGNVPDPTSQASFDAALPGGANGELATLVKGLNDYSIDPSTFSTRQAKGVGAITRAQAVALAKQRDPSYNEGLYSVRKQLVSSFTSGTDSQNITSLNTLIGHLTSLNKAVDSLSPDRFIPLGEHFEPSVSNFEFTKQAVANEMTKLFRGTGGSEADVQGWLNNFNKNSTGATLYTNVGKAIELMASRMDALNSKYEQGMGKAPSKSFLSLNSQQDLMDIQANLQKRGVTIDIPGLANSPLVKLKSFVDANPTNKALLDQLRQANPSLDAYGLQDLLSQNGISL